ncbi:hypothetical protein KAX02_04770 [candidate division WOR-3 bacterium]|nr:hypothetical protein [candidate division WOR-3 bacterium]
MGRIWDEYKFKCCPIDRFQKDQKQKESGSGLQISVFKVGTGLNLGEIAHLVVDCLLYLDEDENNVNS